MKFLVLDLRSNILFDDFNLYSTFTISCQSGESGYSVGIK